MDRRDFLKKAITSGIAAGSSLMLTDMDRLWAAEKDKKAGCDLVAVRGGEPEVMFERAMEALGGLNQFVPAGSSVLVKPNIGWDVPPERAGNTHPGLVGHIVKSCLAAGAGSVSVFDHTCDQWNRCYKTSGIEKAVKSAGGKMISGDSKGYYRKVDIPKGRRLGSASVHQAFLDSDVLINVPVLKHHSSSKVTIGMKNLMGVVWNRWYWHLNDLHQCIADFASLRKPDLTVVDAYNVMKRNGPRGVSVDDVLSMKAQIVSTDLLASDTAATMLFGADPSDIRYLNIASEMNLGKMNLNDIAIKRIVI